MPMRPCLGLPGQPCGRLIRAQRGISRCPDCQAGKRAERPVSYAEQQRRKAVVEAHRAEHGDWCPGWRRPGHEATDLTADHLVPVGAGGDEHGELGVLCRACNSAKRDRLE
jgi:5-methylcytosine-specific restriction protein A